MNYLLIHDGPLPRHVKYCINQIRTIDEDSSIYLGINSNSNIKNATLVDLQDIVSSRTEEVINMNLFSGEENRLWATSLLRIFYLYDLAIKYHIKEFIHFDNDVLIFKKYNELKSNFDFNKFNITPLTNDQLIFGYSFIPSMEVYAKIVDYIYSYLFELSEYEKESIDSAYASNITEHEYVRIIDYQSDHPVSDRSKNFIELDNWKDYICSTNRKEKKILKMQNKEQCSKLSTSTRDKTALVLHAHGKIEQLEEITERVRKQFGFHYVHAQNNYLF